MIFGGLMKKHSIFITFLILLLTVGITTMVFSQQGRGKGRIRGSTMDAAGNPLDGVKITAVHLQYSTTFTSTSNAKGIWAIAGMGSGYFRITAAKEGYGEVYHEMQVSQFSKRNPAVDFTLQKIQAVSQDVPAIEDEAAIALFEEGTQLYEEKKYAEAVVKYEEFIELNPMIYQVNLNIGNCYRELGEYDKAIEAYTNLLEELKIEKETLEGDEGAARALAAIGETYIKKGDLDKASAHLIEAMDIFPEDETLAFNIGEIYFKQGQTDKGVEHFNLAIQIKPDWAPPYRQIGYAYLNQANYGMAVESFKKFVELAPDDPLTPTIQNLIPQLEAMIK